MELGCSSPAQIPAAILLFGHRVQLVRRARQALGWLVHRGFNFDGVVSSESNGQGVAAVSHYIAFLILAQQAVPAAAEQSSPWMIIVVALVAAFMGMGFVKLFGFLRKQD